MFWADSPILFTDVNTKAFLFSGRFCIMVTENVKWIIWVSSSNVPFWLLKTSSSMEIPNHSWMPSKIQCFLHFIELKWESIFVVTWIWHLRDVDRRLQSGYILPDTLGWTCACQVNPAWAKDAHHWHCPTVASSSSAAMWSVCVSVKRHLSSALRQTRKEKLSRAPCLI